MSRILILPVLILAAAGCTRLSEVGKAPDFTPLNDGLEQRAMSAPTPASFAPGTRSRGPSLWNSGRGSLLGDRRASLRGDILTVVIEIDESAEISNSTERSRSGSEEFQTPDLLGVGQAIDRVLPEDGSLSDGVSASSNSRSSGDGAVRRQEELTLRVAATVIEVLSNGVLRIRGSQEVRVNFELRELLVDGYVRPEDITRQNEITYDKIASARISYGGRGQITDVQQPRYGQQIADIILPF